MNYPADTEILHRRSTEQMPEELNHEEQTPEEQTPSAEMPENPWGTTLRSQPTADDSVGLDQHINNSHHTTEPTDTNRVPNTGRTIHNLEGRLNILRLVPAWTKQLIFNWMLHVFRRVRIPVLPRFLVAISVMSAISELIFTPNGINCAVIPYSHMLSICGQTSATFTPNVQLYQSDIPFKRHGLGAVVSNGNDLSYEHARTIQDVEISARDLSASVALSSLPNRWMLKSHINGFVDSAANTHFALLELDAEFSSAMRYLPMLDHQLLHSLAQFEQKARANIVSTALFTFWSVDQGNREDLLDQTFPHDPNYQEPKKAVQKYVSSLENIIRGLIDRTTLANRLVHDMANRLRDIASEANISERELIATEDARILWVLRVLLGTQQQEERDYQRNLKVLSQVDALEKEWKAYYSDLLFALRSGQVDLKRINGDLKLWFSNHSQRSLIEYAMGTLRRSLEAVAKPPVGKSGRIDPSPWNDTTQN